ARRSIGFHDHVPAQGESAQGRRRRGAGGEQRGSIDEERIMETAEQPKATTNKWAERLRGRSRMAVASIGGVFLVGLFLVSRPLSDRIDSASARLGKATDRMMLAAEVSDLRRQAVQYEKKLQRGVDLNDWTNYLLSGVRTEHVRLIRMEPKKQQAIGP